MGDLVSVMLEVENLNAFYGELQILRNLSFKVFKGEIASLIGPNGAGKTTLCRTIIGVHPQRSGSIKFLAKQIAMLKASEIIKLGIAIVPEGRRLFGNMTVRENLELGAFASETREKVNDVLEWVFELFPLLKERQNQLAGSMSGGEQQILAIARALMSKPKLLVLDEPSLGLAPKVVLKVYQIIERLHDEGVTILLVEQYAAHALKISDRSIILENGRIVQEGPSKDLLREESVRKAYFEEE